MSMREINEQGKLTFYAGRDFLPIYLKLKRLAQLDDVSVSALIREILTQYVKAHEPGNPQRPLTAWVPGHKDEMALLRQATIETLLEFARLHDDEVFWRDILRYVPPHLKGRARIREAELIANAYGRGA